MVINNTVYRHYPKIRDNDINTDTSNKFIDTMNISNCYLGAIGGDYDGVNAKSKNTAYRVICMFQQG